MIPRVSDRKIVTYGFSPQADVRGVNLETGPDGMLFDVVVTDRQQHASRTIRGLRLSMFGAYNVQNALAAVAMAEEMRIGEEVLRHALAEFTGVKRRFTKDGRSRRHHRHRRLRPPPGGDLRRAGRRSQRHLCKVIAVVQPHRYTRLRNLFEAFCTCFNDADAVLVADVYPAGEDPIEGVDRDALVDGLRSHGHRMVGVLERPEDLAGMVHELAAPGDCVVCLGAGSITNWANALPDELERLRFAGRRFGRGGRMMAARSRSRPPDRPASPGARPADRERVAGEDHLVPGGRPRRGAVPPRDADDLTDFLAAMPAGVPIAVIGVGSNLLVRDGGIPGVVVRLGGGFAAIEAEGRACGRAPVRPTSTSPRRPATPKSPGSSSSQAFPATSAVRSA